MKATFAIVAVAFPLAAGPIRMPIPMQLAQAAPSAAVAQQAGQNAAAAWDGRWQGTTVAGQELVLDIQVKAQRLSGRLTVGKQSANITAGKALDNAFALTTGPIDGHAVKATGRQAGDAIELTIEGVKEPLTLTRVK